MTDDPALSHLESLCRRVEALSTEHQLHADDYCIRGPTFLMYGQEPEPVPQTSDRATYIAGVARGLAVVALGLFVIAAMLWLPNV